MFASESEAPSTHIHTDRGIPHPITFDSPAAPDALGIDLAAAELRHIFDQELDTAALTVRRNQKVYNGVRQLSELIGGEYGDRVVYELLQNAHDAHQRNGASEIAARVSVQAPDRGVLYVANGGEGFSLANVQAIRNIATAAFHTHSRRRERTLSGTDPRDRPQ